LLAHHKLTSILVGFQKKQQLFQAHLVWLFTGKIMRKSPPRRQPVWGTYLDPNMQGMEKRRVFLPFKIRKLLLRQQILSRVKISLGTFLDSSLNSLSIISSISLKRSFRSLKCQRVKKGNLLLLNHLDHRSSSDKATHLLYSLATLSKISIAGALKFQRIRMLLSENQIANSQSLEILKIRCAHV